MKTEIVDGDAMISVGDNGPGIDEEIQDHIFDPFFTTRSDNSGMGLGLDICKRIIEEHDGTLCCISRPGKTEFIITLPAVQEKQ